MRRPPPDDLDLAAAWAEAYEEGAEDAAALTRVATWLRNQADEERIAEFVREAVRETGCTRARAVRYYRESFKK